MQFINLVHVQRARRALLQLAQGAKGGRQLVGILPARGTLHPGVEIKAEATHPGGLQGVARQVFGALGAAQHRGGGRRGR